MNDQTLKAEAIGRIVTLLPSLDADELVGFGQVLAERLAAGVHQPPPEPDHPRFRVCRLETPESA
jgi:hypothetical protein